MGFAKPVGVTPDIALRDEIKQRALHLQRRVVRLLLRSGARALASDAMRDVLVAMGRRAGGDFAKSEVVAAISNLAAHAIFCDALKIMACTDVRDVILSLCRGGMSREGSDLAALSGIADRVPLGDAVHQALRHAALTPESVTGPETGMYTASVGSPSMLHHHLGRMLNHGVLRCSPMGMTPSATC